MSTHLALDVLMPTNSDRRTTYARTDGQRMHGRTDGRMDSGSKCPISAASATRSRTPGGGTLFRVLTQVGGCHGGGEKCGSGASCAGVGARSGKNGGGCCTPMGPGIGTPSRPPPPPGIICWVQFYKWCDVSPPDIIIIWIYYLFMWFNFVFRIII